MSTPDWVVVGAGFTGAVLAERIASQLEQNVLVVDRRGHIAGNAYDELHETGCIVHRYGPHIFHTNSKMVWKYLERFTRWQPYYHRVQAMVDGCAIPLPFNLNAMEMLFPPRMAERLTEALLARYGYGTKVPILKLKEEPDADLNFLAGYVYEKVFRNYTRKQWDLEPEQLDPGVTARVPISVSRDDRYFQDIYQAMPEDGYTAMFRRILDHPRIEVRLNTPWEQVASTSGRTRVVFTGAIDEFFGYEFGPLPYRSLRFDTITAAAHRGLSVGTLNFPNEFDFTRITDQRHLSGDPNGRPVLIYEYPEAHHTGVNERYYPIPHEASAAALQLYRGRAKQLQGQVFFAGRLGDYAYYNMDQACARALSLFDKQIAHLVPEPA
ncbi:MAG TPA: UDP-galactopyranose mutase [Ancylobacter sp.]